MALRRPRLTIVELALSVVLIAVAATFAIPLWFARAEITLENACVLLARDLRLAQNMAAALRQSTTVEFDAAGTGYGVVGAQGAAVSHPMTDRAFARDYAADAVFEGVRIETVDLSGGRKLTFTPDGRALQGGEIVLSFRSERCRVRVDPGTGFITIVGSRSGWTDDGL